MGSEMCIRDSLGMMLRPDDIQANQFEFLLSKARKWRDSIWTRQIKPGDAWHCMNSTIMRTIEYPLVATNLSRRQCEQIMAPIFKFGLPKSKIQRNMPRALVYGSTRVQGLEVYHPHSTQLIEHLQAIMRHGCRNTPLGIKLRALIEGHALEMGTGTPIWELNYKKWSPLATTTWLCLLYTSPSPRDS